MSKAKEPKIPRGWVRVTEGCVEAGDRVWNWVDGWWYNTVDKSERGFAEAVGSKIEPGEGRVVIRRARPVVKPAAPKLDGNGDPFVPRGWVRVTEGKVECGDRVWQYSEPGLWSDTTEPGSVHFVGDDLGAWQYFTIRKAPKVKREPPVKATKATKATKQYILIAKDKGGVGLKEGLPEAKEIYGPFATPEKARAFVKADSEDCFNVSDGDDLENWGQDWLLCEVVSILRPVPRVKVTMTINERGGNDEEV